MPAVQFLVLQDYGGSVRDIENRLDIEGLVEGFYRRVFADEIIGPIFTDIAKLDLEHHLPIMTDFWETVLFRTGSYSRNALKLHLMLNEKFPLQREHFDRWLEIWQQNVDDYFTGEAANFAKLQAERIAGSMGNRMSAATSGELHHRVPKK
ncbi:MAG: group III truncated hemoglobin [Microbacteriaceae bacterium]